MRIVTYFSEDAPEDARGLAKLMDAQGFLPTSFFGVDKAHAREKAEEFLAEQKERVARLLVATQRPKAGAPKPEPVSGRFAGLLG